MNLPFILTNAREVLNLETKLQVILFSRNTFQINHVYLYTLLKYGKISLMEDGNYVVQLYSIQFLYSSPHERVSVPLPPDSAIKST